MSVPGYRGWYTTLADTTCTCVSDVSAVNGPLEPCEYCATPVRWTTAADLQVCGWGEDVRDAFRPAGFLEASVHSVTADGHTQTWHRHTPERCREARARLHGDRT